MNKRLMYLNVKNFDALMASYRRQGMKFHYCLDGGAGSGHTALAMLKYMEEDGYVFAFEPFVGNHPFFKKIDDKRVNLLKKALYFEKSAQKLFVKQTVSKDSPWGKKGMVGYSSLGFIDKTPETKDESQLYSIECVAADEEISSENKLDFVKLDLQGGELDALKGMERILYEPYFLWIEFSAQKGLLEFLQERGFIIFETQYLFLGSAPEKAAKDFSFLNKASLSTGRSAWFGQRIRPWGDDFYSDFQIARKEYGCIQTDIVCIHASRYQHFIRALKM